MGWGLAFLALLARRFWCWIVRVTHDARWRWFCSGDRRTVSGLLRESWREQKNGDHGNGIRSQSTDAIRIGAKLAIGSLCFHKYLLWLLGLARLAVVNAAHHVGISASL